MRPFGLGKHPSPPNWSRRDGENNRIIVETETLLVIRRAKADLAWCPVCRAEVEVVSLDNDSLAEPVIASQIQELLAKGKVHSWQTIKGPTEIYLASLLRCFEVEGMQSSFRSKETQ